MSAPRRYLPAQRYVVSRRTLSGCFFLQPTPEVVDFVRYALLLVASRFEGSVEVGLGCVLGNHYHLYLRDLRGGADSRLSDLFRDLHSLLGRGLNAQHGRTGPCWDTEPTSALEVHDDGAELRQLVYVMAQPVEAGLVERAEDWPGFSFLPDDLDRVHTAIRPDHLPFLATGRPRAPSELAEAQAEALEAELRRRGLTRKRRRQLQRRLRRREREAARAFPEGHDGRRFPRTGASTLPKRVSYKLPIPKALAHLSAEEARADLWRRLRAEEERIHADRKARGLGFLGVEAILRASHLDRPPADLPRFKRRPVVSCSCPEERFAQLVALVQFRKAHAEGVETLLGEKPWQATFPEGSHLRARELRRLKATLRHGRAPPQAS